MKALRIVGSIAVLLIVFVAGFFAHPAYDHYKRQQVVNPAKEFVSALTAGDNDKAYAMASANLQKAQTEQQFSSAAGDLKSSNPAPVNEVVSVNKDSALYNVTVSNVPADGLGSTTASIQLHLVKQDGKWVVDGVNIQ